MDFDRLFGPDWPPRGPTRPPEGYFTLARWVFAVILVLLLLSALNLSKNFLVDALWFESLGYLDVFYTRFRAEFYLFLVGALLFAFLFWANYLLAQRLSRGLGSPFFLWIEFVPLRRTVRLGALYLGVFLSLLLGSILAQRWEQVLLFLNARPFGLQDPLFARDVGFYVFQLPVLRFFQLWLLGALFVLLLLIGGYYALQLALRGGPVQVPAPIKAHLSGLGALVLVVFAFGHWLDLFHLNFSSRGALYGAGWTDAHVTVAARWLQIAAALLAAALFIANVFRRGVALPIFGLGLWVAVTVVLGAIAPAIVQRTMVEPNEFQREEPYLRSHIDMTRRAFGLDNVQVRSHPGLLTVTPEQISANPSTINNIRIWDHRPLRETFNQIQSIRLYYEFHDVDVDRYTLNGEYRQMMVSARELIQSRLPAEAQGWYNRRLQYTHGYGVAMTYVNEVTLEGLPVLVVKDVPPVGDIRIERPEVYFGERTQDYVIVRTRAQEFDYPVGETNAFTTYQGDGGVPLGSFWRRLLFAWHFEDINLILSEQLTPESRVLFRRTVQERISLIAPFLRLDPDPYIVVADGRLFWIQDAYTVTDRFPYSQPVRGGFNYIRNSVKVVVDAYHGTTTFYVADESDPLVQAYRGVFPSLFQPLDAMPPSLRAHLRYPEAMFMVQADVYRTYHMEDPQVFYNREDLWALPTEIFEGAEQPMQAYYVIMRLPEEQRDEFLLILPFVPVNKQNAIGWLAGRSDEPHRGQLHAFLFPKERLVYGPFQIEARINQDPEISAQFALWNQGGSQVIRGNLLMVPIGDSFLYVEPIYLRSAAGRLPELKRVVIAAGDRIAMEPTIGQSLARIFGTPPPGAAAGARPTPPPAPPSDGTAMGALPLQIREAYQRAVERQRQGDWAGYGQALQELERLLDQLVALSQQQPSPP